MFGHVRGDWRARGAGGGRVWKHRFWFCFVVGRGRVEGLRGPWSILLLVQIGFPVAPRTGVERFWFLAD